MKRVFLYLGMGSCVSSTAKDQRSDNPHSSIRVSSVSDKNTETPKTVEKPATVQALVSEAAGSKEEQFFDSKPWLDSDDDEFVSVYGDNSPLKQVHDDGERQGKRLSELFRDSSFGSDSQTSRKAYAEANYGKDQMSPTMKLERKKSRKSPQRCLPGLVRSLSRSDHKKRRSPVPVAVVGC